MKIAIAGLAVALLAGCAWKSDALKLGPDTYQVSANASPVRGGETGARQMAITKANQTCQGLHKEIEVQNIETSHAFPANGVATVTFRCK